jgi:prolyl 4-hydroxylase
MSFSVINLSSDILIFNDLLDSELCQHIIQVAECGKFEPAGIEVGTVETRIRSNDLLSLDNENSSLLTSTNQLLLGKISIIQQYLYESYGVKFPHAINLDNFIKDILIIYYCPVALKK